MVLHALGGAEFDIQGRAEGLGCGRGKTVVDE